MASTMESAETHILRGDRLSKRAGRMRRWLARSALLLLLFGAAAELARGAGHALEALRFRSYSTADGLSHATVFAILQDPKGYLWIGTQDGLNRFDGYGFRLYRHQPGIAHTLSSGYITALANSRDGRLWIGTQWGGLNAFDPISERFTQYQVDARRDQSGAADPVLALTVDTRDRVWASYESGRVDYYDPAQKTLVIAPFSSAMPRQRLRVLCSLREGGLLLASAGELWTWTDASAALVPFANVDRPALAVGSDLSVRPEWYSPKAIYITALQNHNGDIWVGSLAHGLLRFGANGVLKELFRADPDDPNALPDDSIRALAFDQAGDLWLGTTNGLALYAQDGSGFTSWRNDPADTFSLPGNRVVALLLDRYGQIWAGTTSGGFSRKYPDAEAFGLIRARREQSVPLPSNLVSGMFEEANGNLWVTGLAGMGIARIDLEKGVVEQHSHDPNDSNSLSHRLTQAVLRSRDDKLWVGTLGGGLNRMRADGKSFDHFRADPNNPASLSGDSILHLFEDSSGALWISTQRDGISVLCAGCSDFQTFRNDANDPHSIGSNSINSVYETRNGEIWIATRGGGLNRFDRSAEKFIRYPYDPTRSNTLRSHTVAGLLEDSRGRLWTATPGGGLFLVDRSAGLDAVQLQSYTSENGLPFDSISSVLEDAQGMLWLASREGLIRFDADRVQDREFRVFDGAKNSGHYIGSALRGRDGKLFFGGFSGILVVDPSKVAEAFVLPQVALTDLYVNNRRPLLQWQDSASPLARSLGHLDSLALDYRNDNFSIEFAALNFPHPRGLNYDYRLAGFEQDWTPTAADRRVAAFTNVPPGSYLFEVRASGLGKAEPGPITTLAITVTDSSWMSAEAISVYLAVLVVLAAMLLWRLRSNYLRRKAIAKKIRRNEERLKLALWGSGGELWDLEFESGRIHRENPLPNLVSSVMADNALLADYASHVHPDDLPRIMDGLRTNVRGITEAFEEEYRARSVDGHWMWILSRGRVVERDPNGRALRMVGTNEDITEFKSQEETLKRLNEDLEFRVEKRTEDLKAAIVQLRSTIEQNQQMQRQLVESEKMASLGNLVAGIAHEINTPLGVGVTAASHLEAESMRISHLLDGGKLQRSDLEHFRDMARESSQIILRNLERADKLVKSFKQVAVDQSSEQRRTIELRQYLDEIQTSLQPSLKKTKHRVLIECPNALILDTYPGAIYQIFVNLLMNSLIHGFDGKDQGEVRIAASGDEKTVTILYQDDGKGMSDDVRARIFEPFFTTRRGKGGSGLGMHIVYNLVTQLLRGTIVCDSGPGQGVRFEITISRAAPAEEAKLAS